MHKYNIDKTEPPFPQLYVYRFHCHIPLSVLVINSDVTHFILKLSTYTWLVASQQDTVSLPDLKPSE